MKIIIDSAPGSATDVASRLMAERLTKVWGQQAVIDNQPGAGGSIAVRAASQAEPDGYTLYVGAASTFTALKGAPGVAPNLPIELPRDFTPIGFITQQPMFIAVSPTIGVKSLPELIALAKKKPGELSYATTGRGRITHLTMELLQERAGIKLQMIPYTGGPTAAMADVGTGRVAIVIEGYSGLAGGLTSHLIKGIAVSSLERLDEFKDLATVAEVLPGFIAGGWNVLLAPIGTPERDHPQGQRRPAQGARRRRDQEQARRARRVSASDDARAGRRPSPRSSSAPGGRSPRRWRARRRRRSDQSTLQRLFGGARLRGASPDGPRPHRRRPFPTGRSRSSRRSRRARRTTSWRA